MFELIGLLLIVIFLFWLFSGSKTEAGKPCKSNSDCEGGACGRLTAASGAELRCCPSNKLSSYWGYDYCSDMPNESVCWSDAQCKSGYCKGNSFLGLIPGLQRGMCAAK